MKALLLTTMIMRSSPSGMVLKPAGKNVFVIRRLTIRNADWIIDMWPEGGSKGGKVMFEGTPKQLLTAKQSLASAYLDGGARV
jgi:excinuclease UvrABC ATPase subunit